jgi:hypothetical protein
MQQIDQPHIYNHRRAINASNSARDPASSNLARMNCSWADFRSLSRTIVNQLVGVLIILNLPHSAFGNEITSPIISHQFLLSVAGQYPIDPKVITPIVDDELIIAGSTLVGAYNAKDVKRAAWASKVDRQGNVLWTYTTSQRDEGRIVGSPEFHGAVQMSDGTVFLCGQMPRPPDIYTPALLTHIEAGGRLITEQLLAPEHISERGIAKFDSCARWGEDLVIIGSVQNLVKPPGQGNPPVVDEFFWILKLNKNGNLVWEKRIQITDNNTPNPGEVVALQIGSDLAVSAAGNFGSDLFLVTNDGKVRVTKKLSGRFLIVPPASPDGLLEIFGQATNQPYTAITYDENLNEMANVQGNHPEDFLFRVVFRLLDKSLVLFGSGVYSFGDQYRAKIVHIDKALNVEQYLEPLRPHPSYYDTGSIWAVAPTPYAGSFVIARPLTAIGNPNAQTAAGGLLPGFKRGI